MSSYLRIYQAGMCGAELFPAGGDRAGRGQKSAGRGGAKVKISGVGQKNA